ncbi:MAG: hypothetical protein RR553_02985 [Akkermansia sp.]
MNNLHHKSNAHQVSLGAIIWLVCFASILCGAGICIGVLKNRQIDVRRDMERMQVEIAACNLSADHYKAKVASDTSRWSIRDRLAQDKSTLQNIQTEQMEFVRRDVDQPAVVVK